MVMTFCWYLAVILYSTKIVAGDANDTMSTEFHTVSKSAAWLDLSTKPSGSIDKASHFEATLTLIRLIGDEGSDSHVLRSQDLRKEVESSLPPPEPYYKRSAVLSSTDGFTRTQSLRCYGRDRTAKDFLLSERLNKSMPNTHGSRSHHNRSIGQSAEFKSNTRDRQMLLTRVEEFDALLNEQ